MLFLRTFSHCVVENNCEAGPASPRAVSRAVLEWNNAHEIYFLLDDNYLQETLDMQLSLQNLHHSSDFRCFDIRFSVFDERSWTKNCLCFHGHVGSLGAQLVVSNSGWQNFHSQFRPCARFSQMWSAIFYSPLPSPVIERIQNYLARKIILYTCNARTIRFDCFLACL